MYVVAAVIEPHGELDVHPVPLRRRVWDPVRCRVHHDVAGLVLDVIRSARCVMAGLAHRHRKGLFHDAVAADGQLMSVVVGDGD